MGPSAHTLASYVPGLLLRGLAEGVHPGVAPDHRRYHAAVMFVDVSGFTAMSDQLAGLGPRGAELLSLTLDRCFGPVLERCAHHGGDVLRFSGDSVLVIWTVTDSQLLDRAVVAATQCALDIQRSAGQPAGPDGSQLALTVAVGAGEAVVFQIGGVDDQWEYLVGGPALDEVRKAHNSTRPGDVILSAEAWRWIASYAAGSETETGAVRIREFVRPAPQLEPRPFEITIDLLEEARRFVSRPILDRLDAGPAEWSAELRTISPVLVNIRGVDIDRSRDRQVLQLSMGATQTALNRFGGTVEKILVDDKGAVIVGVLGVPPHSHQDDPTRAIRAAMDLERSLRTLRIEYGIGVTTGLGFCGAYGSEVHREFSILGSVVNIASRLMEAANNETLCDPATAEASKDRIRFSNLGPRLLAGRTQPTSLHRPLWEEEATRKTLTSLRAQLSRRLLGRDHERSQLTAALGGLVYGGKNSFALVEGEAGIGKSALAADLINTAQEMNVVAVMGAGEEIDASTPYHAWRAVLAQLLELSETVDPAQRRARVQEALDAPANLEAFLALLNGVLDVDFPDTEQTIAMSPRSRRHQTAGMLVRLLERAAAGSRLLIVLEDVHWLDPSSWELALMVADQVTPLMLVMTTRPVSNPPPERDTLLRGASTLHLRLGALDPRDAVAIVCDKLGVDGIPEEVASLIRVRASGHPLFSEQLAFALLDAGVMVVEGRSGKLGEGRHVDADLILPDEIQKLVASRLDQLSDDTRLTLKVASVLGESFDLDGLAAIHPNRLSRVKIREQLDQLETLQLTTSGTAGGHAFRHAIIRAAAYQLFPPEQQRRLHRAAAEWYEPPSEPESGSKAPLAILAHHWERAGDAEQALGYLEEAGREALDEGANVEAIEFYRRAADLDSSRRPEGVDDRRRALWSSRIGEAKAAQGDFIGAEIVYRAGLSLLGYHLPKSTLGRVLRLVAEVIRQIVHLLGFRGKRAHQPDRIQAARLCSLLGEVHFFNMDLLGFPLVNLMSINLAEASGRSEVAGLAYSNLSYLVGVMRLHRLAKYYNRRAASAEEASTTSLLPGRVDWISRPGSGHKVAAANSRAAYNLGIARWPEVYAALEEGIEACRRLRDDYTLGICLALRAYARSYTAPVSEAAGDYQELLESAIARANTQHQAWAFTYSIPGLLAAGDRTEAAARLVRGRNVIEHSDLITPPVFRAMEAQILADGPDTGVALEAADKALRELSQIPPVFTSLAGYTALFEALIAIGQRRLPVGGEQRLRLITRKARTRLRRYVLVFPFARPRLALYTGVEAIARGRTKRGLRVLARGLREAEDKGIPVDEAMLLIALIEALPADERPDHLVRANELCRRLDLTQGLSRLAMLEAS